MTSRSDQKKASLPKWRPHKARRLLYKPSYVKKERNGSPSANQRLSTAMPRSSHAVSPLWVPPPVAPFLLAQNVSPKNVTGNDITSSKSDNFN